MACDQQFNRGGAPFVGAARFLRHRCPIVAGRLRAVRVDSRVDLAMTHTVALFKRAARIVRHAATIAALAPLPIAAAVAADARASPLPDASAPFGPMGWALVVVLGLLAVAAGALTLGRPHRPKPLERAANDSTLGTTIVVEPAAAGTRDVAAAEGGGASAPRPPEPDPMPAPAPAAAHAGRDAGSHACLALHHVDLSIDVLHRHIDDEPRPMPAVWVMLLDLCRTHGREQKFHELALEFHRRFNVRSPNWERYPSDRGEPGLEAYPRLVRAITATWGTHECRRMLDRLLYDNRGGARRGFTLNAYNDLIALRRAAHSVLDTIQSDLALEARQRTLSTPSTVAVPGEVSANDESASPSPLIQDLRDQLERDLEPAAATTSALEREHPAFIGVLAREWGNAALAGRLCEMLARGGDGAPPLSPEVAEELELLRRMAERLGKSTGKAVAAGD
jgi:hypothetical protein